MGLSLQFNLAIGVNDPVLINKIEMVLEEGSSNIMDTLITFCKAKEEELEAEFNNRKEAVTGNDSRLISSMKRSVNEKKAVDFSRMKQKLMSLKRRIILPEMFKRSRGSRRIKARFYRPSQVHCEPSPHVSNVRQHRRERREPRERLRLRRVKAKEQRRRRKLRL